MEQESIHKKREVVSHFLNKKILISSDLNTELAGENFIRTYEDLLGEVKNQRLLFLSKDLKKSVEDQKHTNVNWRELERSKVLFEKGENKELYPKFISSVEPEPGKKARAGGAVDIVFSYSTESKKRTIQDFVSLFNARYETLRKILINRQELNGATSINKLQGKKDRGHVSIIGMISDKNLTKNGNLMLTLEDPSGTIKVLVNKNKPDIFNIASSSVLDEVVGINGANGDNIIFCNSFIQPGIPLTKEHKKSPDEVYALFLSDLHIGSNNFLPEEFDKFINWINAETGNEAQQEIAKKVKYLFIAGDLVDGVGIYPNQNTELVIDDIYGQYKECARLLKKIPSHINIIICPGNHDAMRIAEPQPILYEDFAKPIWELENVTLVSNPSLVNIHASEGFSGFDVLLYHGYSFDYFIANVESIRTKGGYDRADLVMSFLLERRHLAPSHKSTLYLPDADADPLLINKIPDFFVTGHIHKSAVANYKNITTICGSCWQAKTTFQEKVGHHPDPAKVPAVNLQTRQIKILNFSK